MKIRPVFLLVPSALCLAACGASAPDSGFAACESAAGPGNPADVVARCTPVIDSSAATPRERAYAHMYRAGALQSQNQVARALGDSDEAVRLVPGDANLIANRGAIYGMQGQLALAQHDLEEALKIDANNMLAIGNLAIIHSRRSEWAESRAMIARGLAIEPNHVALRSELCWTGAVSDANAADALPDCDNAIRISKNDPNNFNSRGLAQFRAGKFAEAIADYDRSLEGNANVGSSWYMRGMSKRAAGMEGAQEDIDRGLQLEPGVDQRYAGYGVTPP